MGQPDPVVVEGEQGTTGRWGGVKTAMEALESGGDVKRFYCGILELHAWKPEHPMRSLMPSSSPLFNATILFFFAGCHLEWFRANLVRSDLAGRITRWTGNKYVPEKLD